MNGQPVRVLFDGWSLVNQPNHPAALHLLELLNHFPENFDAFLALPRPLKYPLTLGNTLVVVEEAGDTAGERLRWEQSSLTQIGKRVGANLLHLVTPTPALTGRLPVVVSPAGYGTGIRNGQAGWQARMREALASGGMSRASAIFWPAGLPAPKLGVPVYELPGLVAPDFNPHDPVELSMLEEAGLPETYLLYHGPQDLPNLNRLLAAWSWAAGSIGELFPLALLGAPRVGLGQDYFKQVRQLGFERSLYVLPEFHPELIPGIYRGCSGLFHLGEVSAWGGSVRYALACGKPVVAEITHLAEALVGSAGYLLDGRDTRQLGAALLAVVVNEEVSTSLRAAALKQAGSWETDQFREKLAAAYRIVLGRE